MQPIKELKFNKGYKISSLCSIFGKEKLKGSYLKTFIKELERNYVIEKRGMSYFIIRELSDEEKNFTKAKGYYQKAIEAVLSDKLSRISDNKYCFSIMELLISLGIVTDDYKYCRYNINETALVLETDPYEIEKYINISYDLLSSLIKNVLDTLDDKSLILKADTFKVYNKHKGKMFNLRQATENEKNTILEIRGEAFKELGVSGKKELYSTRRFLIEKYNQICIRKCRERRTEFDGFFDAMELSINKKGLKENANELVVELNVKMQEKLLSAKGLKEIQKLELLVDATLSLDRPYKIKENVKKMQGSTI